jgi:hypothetical protein
VEWNGAGLRATTAKQEDDSQRRRSPAKPDGLGGVVSLVTGEEGIYAAGGRAAVVGRVQILPFAAVLVYAP